MPIMALAFAPQLVFHHRYSSSNNTLTSKSKINKQQMLMRFLHYRNATGGVITAAMKNRRVRKKPRRFQKIVFPSEAKSLMEYAHQLTSRVGFDLDDCKEMHKLILDAGFEQDEPLASKLISMYATCGSVEDARQVFDKMTDKFFVVLWNAMISGYARSNLQEEALILYSDMKSRGIHDDEITLLNVLTACAGLYYLEEGKHFHLHIIKRGFHSHVNLGNALVNMYAKCGDLEDARQVFDEMSERYIVLWNTIISGFAQNGDSKVAMVYFCRMLDDSVIPNVKVLVSALKACTGLEVLNWGKEIHGRLMKIDSECNLYVGTALVAMYGQCKRLEAALRVFNRVSEKNVVLWTAMICAYSQNGSPNQALKLFRQMLQNSVKPNLVSIISVIPAIGDLSSLKQGKEIHCYVIRNKFESDVNVGSALVAMYARCKRLEVAQRVFDRISERNLNLWGTMISSYSQDGRSTKALKLFLQMQQTALKPDVTTIASFLPACVDLAYLKQGKEIHCYAIRNKFESDTYVGSALIAMYGRCKRLDSARRVFDRSSERSLSMCTSIISAYFQNGYSNKALKLLRQMRQHAVKFDPVTIGSTISEWNAMIALCVKNGQGKEAIKWFQQMQKEGMQPNGATFVNILKACSHANLVTEGWQYFNSMSKMYHIMPEIEHYQCIFDLLGHAGRLTDAHDLIQNMTVEPNVAVLRALLRACRIHYNVELGETAARHLFKVDPGHAKKYILLSKIYAAAGRWSDVERVRRMMIDRGIQSLHGRSWIDVKNEAHSFMVLGYLSLLPRKSMFVVVTILLLGSFLKLLTMKA